MEENKRNCLICNHPERETIELDIFLYNNRAATARRYGMKKWQVQHHVTEHLTPQDRIELKNKVSEFSDDLPAELEPVESNPVLNIDDRAKSLYHEIDQHHKITNAVIHKAHQTNDLNTLLKALQTSKEYFKLKGSSLLSLERFLVAKEEITTGDIMRDRSWLGLMTLIQKALKPYPEAKKAVADELVRFQEYVDERYRKEHIV